MTIHRTSPHLAVLFAGALIMAGCSSVSGTAAVDTAASSANSITVSSDTTGTASAAAATAGSTDSAAASTDGTVFDAATVHTISISIDDDALIEILQTYVDSQDKVWGTADVTIDGVTYQDAGIKLKGNSSLRGVSTSSKAETLPWRIRLDKYVDGQNADGYTDFTIRGNNSETSMNEAVALDLLGAAGLATEHAVATRFSVNGSDETVRLAVQNLDDTWVAQNFPDAGADSVLYKSDADGDWSWRGEDGDYTTSFDIEAGPDNYDPLIELLDLLNNGTDEEKQERLPELVDLDSFATYLAFEDLVGNFDDIDGPGNNSYLFWDSSTKRFTVVAWDHNLAFGGTPGGMGGQGGMGGRPGRQGNGGVPANGDGFPTDGTLPTDVPDGFTPPTDGAFPTGVPAPSGNGPGGFPGGADGQNGQDGQGRGGFPRGKSNPLVDAFNAVTEWADMKTAATETLTESLVDSGALDNSVTRWQDLLSNSATDLIDQDTIEQEADAIRTYSAGS